MTEIDTFKNGIGIGVLESQTGAVENIQEDSPIAINGVAIPENTVLKGGQGVEHYFSPDKAQEAARVLQSQIDANETVHLVKNFHDTEGMATADDVIGEITAAGYSKGVGTIFEAETTDMETAQKIHNGYLNISPSIARALGALDETMQARAVEEVDAFRDIAVVARGQPGADVDIGSNPAVEALSRVIEFEAYESENENENENKNENEPMSLDEAKETIAEEYEIDTDTLDEKLREPEEPEEPEAPDDENVVVLIED